MATISAVERGICDDGMCVDIFSSPVLQTLLEQRLMHVTATKSAQEREISDDDLFSAVFSSPAFLASPALDVEDHATAHKGGSLPESSDSGASLTPVVCGKANRVVSTTPQKRAQPPRLAEKAVTSLRRSARQRERQVLQCWKAEQQFVPMVSQCDRARSDAELQFGKRGVKRKLDSVKAASSKQLSDDELSTSIGGTSPSHALSDSESPPASPLVVGSPPPARSPVQRSAPRSGGEVNSACGLRRSRRQQERREREQPQGCATSCPPARAEALLIQRGSACPMPPTTVKVRLSARERAIPQNFVDFIAFEDPEPPLRLLQSRGATLHETTNA